MTRVVIGLDTSCYTTSAAAVTVEGQVVASCRKLLPVKEGERGLRQSEAVFIHVRQLPGRLEELGQAIRGMEIAAVCVSSRPRDEEESYMPVFHVGDAQGRGIAAMLGVPCFASTHQRGHIAAARVDSGVEDGDDLHWKELKGDRIVTARGDDWVQVQAEPGGDYFYGTLTKGREMLRWTGIDGKGATMEGNTDAFRLERRVPDLDYLTECDNRLWGCAQNENVIYGCKLGDPTNWFSYRGIAEDSYAVTVGSDGPFTGAATCLGSVLFFKENALHKLYGSKPSDFQLSSLRCRGVARNAASSLCVLNETLYYLSPDGVMAWDGSIPTKVSEKLNTARLSNVQTAVGGALDGRYYLYLARDSGREGDALEERLLVYDTERGLWQEEDGCSYAMASTGGQLYLWDGHDIWAADPSRERDWKTTEGVEETVDFELITGAFGMDEAEDRYLSRLTLQMDAVCASTVELAICYDDGPWEKLAQWAVAGKQKRFDLHLAPRRCGMFRLRLTGKGQITLRSLARTLATARGRLMEQEA